MVQKMDNASRQPIETRIPVPASGTGGPDNLVPADLERLAADNKRRNRRCAVHLQLARSVGKCLHCSNCRGYNDADFGLDLH